MSNNIHDLSEEAISQLVLSGSNFDEPRGLLDVFTEEEVLSLTVHPKWYNFSPAFQDWVNASIDGIMVERLKVENNANNKQ